MYQLSNYSLKSKLILLGFHHYNQWDKGIGNWNNWKENLFFRPNNVAIALITIISVCSLPELEMVDVSVFLFGIFSHDSCHPVKCPKCIIAVWALMAFYSSCNNVCPGVMMADSLCAAWPCLYRTSPIASCSLHIYSLPRQHKAVWCIILSCWLLSFRVIWPKSQQIPPGNISFCCSFTPQPFIWKYKQPHLLYMH